MTTTTSTRDAYPKPTSRLGFLNTSAVTFTRSRATQSAASLAYYTFFSIFPLMLVLILVGSYFLDRQSILQRVTQAVQGVIPISQQFIIANLQEVLKQRAAVGLFVLVSLLWSASNMFNNLAYYINEAWPEAKARGFLQSRLIGLDMILGLVGLLILSIVLDSVTKWLGSMAPSSQPFSVANGWAVVSSVGSWIAVFLLYLAMYRWVPTVSVTWSASFWGALAASIGWKAATTAFGWYLGSPFARYQLVYGSLGAVVAFLFLIYIIAVVTLYGAHLTAAIDQTMKRRAARALSGTASDSIPGTGRDEHQQQAAASQEEDRQRDDDLDADSADDPKPAIQQPTQPEEGPAADSADDGPPAP